MKINTYENRLLLILFICFGFVFFDRLAISFLFPFIAKDLGLHNAQLGLLSSVLALMWATSGATLGHYADRKQAKKTILIASVVVFTLCSIFSGLVTSFITLLVFRALMGIAEGPVLPVSQSLLVAASTPKRRGVNMGLVTASAPGLIGSVVAPPVLVGIATHFGWRSAFCATAIPGALIVILIALFVRNRHVHRDVLAEREVAPQPGGGYMSLLKSRNILLCVLISCVYVSWFITLITFTPTFLVKVKGFSPETMSGIMGSLGVAWVVWGFVISALSDRFGRKPVLIFFSMIATLCPMVLLYVNSASAMLPLVFLTYTGLGCFTLFMATIPAETVSAARVATALGLIMGVGELFGGCITPTVAGFAADAYGLKVVMWIAAGGALMATLLACFLTETAPVKAREPAAIPQRVGGEIL